MTARREEQPAIVPPAQQAGADHPLWRCAHPCVWTPRMLTALVTRAEGGPWFRLFDKVFAERNLLASFQQVAVNDGAPGVDRVTLTDTRLVSIARNWMDLPEAIRDQLESLSLQPSLLS